MKKSRNIMLSFLCGTALLVTSCSDSNAQDQVVGSVKECVEKTGQSETVCQSQFSTAKAEHEKSAPKFSTQASCAEQFGADNCHQKTNSDGSSSFMPIMMGFMMGHMLAGNNNYSAPAPVYRSTSGNTYTAKSYATGTPVKSVSSSRSSVSSSKSSASSRGGFGGSARSSFGG